MECISRMLLRLQAFGSILVNTIQANALSILLWNG